MPVSLYLPEIRAVLDDLAKRWEKGWKDQAGARRPDLKLIRSTADSIEAAPRARRDSITEPLQAVVKKLRPDLDEDELKLVVETFHAIRARAEYRRSKQSA